MRILQCLGAAPDAPPLLRCRDVLEEQVATYLDYPSIFTRRTRDEQLEGGKYAQWSGKRHRSIGILAQSGWCWSWKGAEFGMVRVYGDTQTMHG